MTMSSRPVPRHVALIMDGNRRWAKLRGFPHFVGHTAGARRIRPLVEGCMASGVECLTLFAFSTENWKRLPEEISALTKLFLRYLRKEAGDLHARGIRLRIIGDISRFGPPLVSLAHDVQQLTADNTRFTLTVAVNYGGRWDLLQAMKAWCADHPGASADALQEDDLQPYLSTAGMPDVDLLIRTGGECRISNFLLWQSAYAEMYFTDTLFPAFTKDSLQQALAWFGERDRRFGGSETAVPALAERLLA